MLCQLVCVDRRYQRMNCFNIRELQGILKRKFFTDLINSNDHRELLDKSVIGLRFKNNNTLNTTHDMPLFYNLGTTTGAKDKLVSVTSTYESESRREKVMNFINNLLQDEHPYTYFTVLNSGSTSQLMLYTLKEAARSLFSTLSSLNMLGGVHATVLATLPQGFTLTAAPTTKAPITSNTYPSHIFSSENVANTYESIDTSSSLSELSNTLRFTRFNNPLVSYDYKCGNYLGI